MKNHIFQIADGMFIIEGKKIDLPYPAVEALECNNSIIVRVESPVGKIFNRNIFAFTVKGELIWQVDESPHGTEVDKPYIGISCDKNENLVAANWNGVDYAVDMDTGAISAKAFNK